MGGKTFAAVCAVGVLLSGCASINLDNYVFEDAEISYRTSFDEVDHQWYLQNTARISDGVLHVNGMENPATAELNHVYGKNSITSFSVRLSTEKPEMFINVLTQHDGGYTRLATILRSDNRHIFAWDRGKEVFNRFNSGSPLRPDTWHDVAILLSDTEYFLFVDGRLVERLRIPDELPNTGSMNFEYHSEYSIKDLEIRTFDSYTLD